MIRVGLGGRMHLSVDTLDYMFSSRKLYKFKIKNESL